MAIEARVDLDVVDVSSTRGRRHDPDLTVEPAQRVLGRSASLRLSVLAAKARIGMWQACPAMDPARNADQVLAEVLHLLEGGDR